MKKLKRDICCCEGFFSLWAVELTRVMKKIPHFGVGIVWGTIPSGLPVFWIIVPGCSRNSHGTSPNLWVQEEIIKLWQGSQDAWLCSAKFPWELSGNSTFNLLRDLGDETLELIQGQVRSVLYCFYCLQDFSLKTAANFFLFLNVAILLRENSC